VSGWNVAKTPFGPGHITGTPSLFLRTCDIERHAQAIEMAECERGDLNPACDRENRIL